MVASTLDSLCGLPLKQINDSQTTLETLGSTLEIKGATSFFVAPPITKLNAVP